MIKTIRSQAGFTLLELILSLFIIAAIAGISMGGIRLGITTRDIGDKKIENLQRLRIIGEQISQKLKSAYPKFIQVSEFLSKQANNDAKQPTPVLAFEGKPDSIRFLTFSPPLVAGGEPSPTHEVHFYLGKHPQTQETGIIMMERDLSNGDAFQPIKPHIDKIEYILLAKNVAYLRFRYYQISEVPLEEIAEEDKFNSEKSTEPTKKNQVTYSGEWVENIRFEPQSPGFQQIKKGVFEEKNSINTINAITLPKGVEISIGLYDQAPETNPYEDEPKLIYSPPIIVPLHSGTIFAIATEEEENDET
jgi:prepilin-type N-terminal cleavage/methylation domain-containing protein